MFRFLVIIFLIWMGYEAILMFSPDHKRPTINDIVIPSNKKEEYVAIINKVKAKNYGKIQAAKEAAQKEGSIQEVKRVEETVVSSDSPILFKVGDYRVENNNLIMSGYFHNKGDREYKRPVAVKCIAFENGAEVDIFSWKKSLNIKSKQTMLIKDMNFGYASMGGFNDLSCKVH